MSESEKKHDASTNAPKEELNEEAFDAATDAELKLSQALADFMKQVSQED